MHSIVIRVETEVSSLNMQTVLTYFTGTVCSMATVAPFRSNYILF